MSRLALIIALSKHRGAPLTDDVVHALVRDVYGEDAPIDLGQFAPEQAGPYSIGCERFEPNLEALHALHQAHWLETERYRHGLALSPDYPAMVERERRGNLLQIMVRRDGALVGQLRMYLAPCLHTRQLVAEEDTLFVLPEHRGGPVAIRMMRYAQRCLRTLGAREIRANSKLSNRADVLMRRLGYEPVAIQFAKVFPQT